MLLPILSLLALAAALALLARALLTRAPLLDRDPHLIHSYVSFRELDLPRGSWSEANRPLVSRLCEVAARRGLRVEALERVGGARRATFGAGSLRVSLTLGRTSGASAEWLLIIDQRFPHGRSAPHDTPAMRDLLLTLRDALHELPIGSVRWHKREDWEAGYPERWTHRPCPQGSAT
jgi:hypothetical protein